VCVRIIKESTLRDFAARHPEAAPGLEVWRRVTRRETFRHFADLRRCFRSADQVRVASGSPVVVFNIHGNDYRLICAIHYNTGKVFLLRFLSHAEYDKDRWKDEL
jgi:mRNA interferase HigB